MTTPAQQYQIGIGNSLLGPGTNYVVHEIDGLGAPAYRIGDQPRALDDGLYFNRDFLGGRPITIKLTVIGSGSPVMPLVNALLTDWQSDTSNSLNYKALQTWMPGVGVLELHGRPRRAVVDSTKLKSGIAPVVLEYVAADPRWYASSVNTVNLPASVPAQGFAFPVTFNLVFGVGATYTGLLLNNGNYKTRPVVTINGPSVNPRIINDTLGLTTALNMTLAASDVVVINYQEHTITLNGLNSAYGYLSFDSVWWDLSPSVTSQVRYVADSFGAQSVATFAWQDAYL